MAIILSPNTHFAQEGGNLNTSTNNHREAKIYVKYDADACGNWLVVLTYNTYARSPHSHTLMRQVIKSGIKWPGCIPTKKYHLKSD